MDRVRKGFLYSVGKNLHVGPWKRMWMEIPHVPFFGIQAFAITGFAFFFYFKYYEEGIDLVGTYTVMRPDDPRVPKLKNRLC